MNQITSDLYVNRRTGKKQGRLFSTRLRRRLCSIQRRVFTFSQPFANGSGLYLSLIQQLSQIHNDLFGVFNLNTSVISPDFAGFCLLCQILLGDKFPHKLFVSFQLSLQKCHIVGSTLWKSRHREFPLLQLAVQCFVHHQIDDLRILSGGVSLQPGIVCLGILSDTLLPLGSIVLAQQGTNAIQILCLKAGIVHADRRFAAPESNGQTGLPEQSHFGRRDRHPPNAGVFLCCQFRSSSIVSDCRPQPVRATTGFSKSLTLTPSSMDTLSASASLKVTSAFPPFSKRAAKKKSAACI